MANFTFNIAKGRVTELYRNVDLGTPSTARLVIAVLRTLNLESDAVLIDKDTFADVVSGTTDEATNTGYAKKILTTTDLATATPDDTNDRINLSVLANPTWTTVGAGDGWSKLVFLYDPLNTQVAANMIPLTAHDFVVVPDGSDIVAQVGALGFYQAS